jgi:hypothetical protein
MTAIHKVINFEYQASRANALLGAGKNNEAAIYLAIAVAQQSAQHDAWHLLSVAETQRGRHADALKAIERAVALAPDEMPYRQQHGFVLVNQHRFKEAVDVLLPLMRSSPDDYATMRALQIACHYAGNALNAIALGRKLLKRDDATAMTIARESPAADIMPFARGDARIISFSLPDANVVSAVGAVANAKLAREIYPGWRCRFYLGKAVPASIKAALLAHGAELIEAWEQYADVPPVLWPYLASDDLGVAVLLCRNTTARLSRKEAAAVNAWLSHGRRAHVMRDHILHRNLVMPGLWGARTDNPLFVAARIQRFMAAYGNPPNGREQRFLDSEIWPAIRDDCLVHDSHYNLFNAQPFPVMGKGNDQFHVGMNITKAEALRREAQSLGLAWPPV